ncbi:MAG: 3-deoxy-D-manno-octulosonic acid transferase [bacterium]|nr:3-deoxy-D-manno-octulosonic acid transferase [bacterium]
MIVVYNILLLPVLVLGLPLALIASLFSKRLRHGFLERLYPLPGAPGQNIWLHAASVGEVEAAAPLVAALLERRVAMVATTSTTTGRDRMRALFPGLAVRLAPLDFPGLVQVSVRRVRVKILVLVETEIWPNLIHATRAAGGRVVMVSGRISDRSLPRYRRMRWLFAPALARIARIGARSEEDRDRLLALGANPETTRVVGDLKLDRDTPPPASEELRNALGEGPLLVAGSTHPGEEEALLSAWQSLRERAAPGMRLVLVPRHPERVPEVLKTAKRYGAEAEMRSAGAGRADVVVVDTVGELGAIYGLADLVFVGGTLARIGGHNLVEPVRAGRVVVHGPHTGNQRAQRTLLDPLGVLNPIENARELAETLERLWLDPERHAFAKTAGPVLDAHRGASERCLQIVLGSETDGA